LTTFFHISLLEVTPPLTAVRDMWTRVYSPAHSITADPLDAPRRRVMTAWDLRKKYGSDWSNRVCFRQAAVGIYGPAAPITVASWNTPCSNTALIRAYSDFVIRGLNLQHATHYAQAAPERTINILVRNLQPHTLAQSLIVVFNCLVSWLFVVSVVYGPSRVFRVA
jgi:hypothetical protein